MPKGFSDKEKEKIKTALRKKGAELFCSYGLKKTGISDITKAVGIAQGSFYSFFESKEELYFDIIEQEESAIKQKLLLELRPYENSPSEYLYRMLTHSFELMEDSPLMLQLYEENTMELLARRLPEERLSAHINKDHSDLLPIISEWKEKGILIEEDLETITSMIRSLFLLSLHKREIGEKHYDKTIHLMIRLISDGIVAKEAKSCPK